MASIWTLHIQATSSYPLRTLPNEQQSRSELGFDFSNCTSWRRTFKFGKFLVRAVSSDDERRPQNDDVVIPKSEKVNAETSRQNPVAKSQEFFSSVPMSVYSTGKFKVGGTNFTIGLCILVTMLVFAVRKYATRKSKNSNPGSIADLVRRGQLRSDRRGISTPLKYEDPFNNPMIKVSKSNSTVEMCGKVYRLAPVTLTGELQTIHQRRRSRAYQWKRPTMFLKEGESVPLDVDPDTVRWIPANHPFATTSSDIDESLAQNNVYQKHGVPFRIKAEHEELQKKLEALQNEQKFNKLVIDPAAARDFERPFKSQMKSENHSASNSKLGSDQPSSDRSNSSFGNKPPFDDKQDS